MERVVMAMLFAVLAAVSAWTLVWSSSTAANRCRALYAQAKTARDSAAVDETDVGVRPAWTCAQLRALGTTGARPAPRLRSSR